MESEVSRLRNESQRRETLDSISFFISKPGKEIVLSLRYNILMTRQSQFAKWTGILLFIIGISIGLTLSACMAWGEMEASLDITLPDAKSLDISCPLALSYNETGIVRAVIVNETEKEVKPVVRAGFGQKDTSTQQQVNETFILGPKETQAAQWSVDASQSAFGRIIPVSVVQSRYNRNPPRWGTCSILLFSLFGLSGASALTAIILSSILSIAAGFILSRAYFVSQGDRTKSFTQMMSFLAFLAVTALVCSCLRWWGLTILLETLAAITIGVIVTELIAPHQTPS